MTKKTNAAPVLEQQRIEAIDMMRGLALLGILLANSMHFQFGLFLNPDIHSFYPLGMIDRLAEMFIVLFAQASFYTLFSFLFGYGMVLLKVRLLQQELNYAPIYWRRMLILLIVGYVHGLFIWDGDILFTYAISGFILFFFLKLKDKGLLIWSIILLSLMAMSITSSGEDEYTASIDEQLMSYSIEEKEVLSQGSYTDVVSFRESTDPLGMGLLGEIITLVSAMISVLGMFLLGAFVARKKWLEDPHKYRGLIKRIWWITLLTGFPCKLAFLINSNIQTETLHSMIGGPIVAMFYASSIALLATTPKGHKLLQPLTYVGRLSLTNYLMQSIVFTSIFYGYGLDLFGKIGYFSGVLLVFGFFIIQIIVSCLWLKAFYIGPFEWFWRACTYLKLPKLKR